MMKVEGMLPGFHLPAMALSPSHTRGNFGAVARPELGDAALLVVLRRATIWRPLALYFT